ncbi:MAG: hypothetical protein AAFY24_01870 [Pseudomonadota bacterium]
MPMARVSAGHFIPDTVGEGRKSCINLFSEENPTDPERPMRHYLRPGSVSRDTGNILNNVPRGIAQSGDHAGGKILVNDGETVRAVTTSGSWSTLTGSIAGSDRAQWAFSEVQGACLSDGRIFISDGSTITEETDADYELLLSNHSVTGGFTSIASIGQRLLFTFGSRLGWSDTLDFNSTVTTYFLTTEDSPDLNVAVYALNGIVYVFGTQTVQPFSQTGGEGAAAFRPINNSTIQRGCLARDTIVQLDNTLFWVGENFEVYRMNGLTPQSVIGENTWVSRRLRLEAPADLVASKLEIDGQSFYVLNGRLGCYVYSIKMQTWFLWKTYEQETWEWSQIVAVGGDHFAISRLNADFGQLSREYVTDGAAVTTTNETDTLVTTSGDTLITTSGDTLVTVATSTTTYGQEIVWEVSAHLPVIGGRKPIPSIRVDGTKGRGNANLPNEDAYISMALSKDNGNTLGNYRDRSIGKQGEYKKRAIWRQNGRAREPQVIAFFRSNDPAMLTAIAVGED